MPRLLLMATLIATLVAVLFTALPAAADPGGLVVDDHWVDVIQQDDGRTLMVKETLWFNNSGDANYNGSLRTWLPREVKYPVVCVVAYNGSYDCLALTQVRENVLEANPFPAYNSFLSYYGQQAELALRAGDANGSVTLPLTVLLGEPPGAREANATGSNLTLASTVDTLAVNLGNEEAIPRNMTALHTLTLRNEGADNRTLELEATGLPAGWRGWFFDQAGNTTLTLAPGDTRNLTLHLQIPSYQLKLRVEYAYEMALGGKSTRSGTFAKELVYETARLEIYVFAFTHANVTLARNLEPIFQRYYAPYDRDWYFARSFSPLAPEEEFAVSITWHEVQEEPARDWTWPAAIAGALAVGGFIFWQWRRGSLFADDDEEWDEDELEGDDDGGEWDEDELEGDDDEGEWDEDEPEGDDDEGEWDEDEPEGEGEGGREAADADDEEASGGAREGLRPVGKD